MSVHPPPEGAVVDLGIPGLLDAVEIGRGGSGVVYRARQPELNRVVAVKVLSAVLDQAAREKFEREAYAMGTVAGHPNIVQVFTTGTTAHGRPYLTMPYVVGGSLAGVVPLPWQQAVAHTIRLCGALDTAHRTGVLHRDVKPSNVLVSPFGEPLLADFGIARVAGGYETSQGLISASIPYAAPEVLSGQPASPAADVYSLAATLFCAIAGKAPFTAGPDEALVALYLRITRDPVPNLRERGIPDPICWALEQGLAKEPGARPPSATAFGQLLQQAQQLAGQPPTSMATLDLAHPPAGHLDSVAPTPNSGTPFTAAAPLQGMTALQPAGGPATMIGDLGGTYLAPALRPRRRRGWLVIALAAVVVIAGVVTGAVLLWPKEQPPQVPGNPLQPLGLAHPVDLVVAGDGSLLIADYDNHRVLRVTSTGAVEPVAGTGESGDGGDGRPATGAELNHPSAIALAPDTSLYIATDGRIRRIDPAGSIRPVTGFDENLRVTAMAVGADGSLYVGTDDTVLRRDPEGNVTSYATGFDAVEGLLVEADGKLLVSDSGRDQVLRLNGPNDWTPIIGSDDEDASDGDSLPALDTEIRDPSGMAFDPQGRLVFSETGNNRVRRVQADGTLLTIAGDPEDYQSGDEGDGGDAIKAKFDLINGAIAIDAHGTLYVADEGNNRIRRVTAAGTVEAFG